MQPAGVAERESDLFHLPFTSSGIDNALRKAMIARHET